MKVPQMVPTMVLLMVPMMALMMVSLMVPMMELMTVSVMVSMMVPMTVSMTVIMILFLLFKEKEGLSTLKYKRTMDDEGKVYGLWIIRI